jgi:dCMP deaminase
MANKDIRPSWDESFMEVTEIFAKRSRCCHYKVGAVIARNKQLLSIGYNGPVAGEPHCTEVGCAKMKDGVKLPPGSGFCRGAHAEMNAIANAANLGVGVSGATLYVSYRPCLECTKHIINAGIRRVVYLNDYDGDLAAIDLMNRVGVGLIKFSTISKMKFK